MYKYLLLIFFWNSYSSVVLSESPVPCGTTSSHDFLSWGQSWFPVENCQPPLTPHCHVLQPVLCYLVTSQDSHLPVSAFSSTTWLLANVMRKAKFSLIFFFCRSFSFFHPVIAKRHIKSSCVLGLCPSVRFAWNWTRVKNYWRLLN